MQLAMKQTVSVRATSLARRVAPRPSLVVRSEKVRAVLIDRVGLMLNGCCGPKLVADIAHVPAPTLTTICKHREMELSAEITLAR